MRVFITSIFIFLIYSSEQRHNDLIDYGFKGKIKKVTLIEYLNPHEISGKWNADKEPRFTKTMIFNDDGMITEELYRLRDKSYTRKYLIKGDKRIECSETGDNSGNSKFTYTDSTIIEKHYDLSGVLDYEAITFFDKNKLTTKEVYKYYNNKGFITDYNTTYFINRIEGYFNKFLIVDSTKNMKTLYEFVILNKDIKNNPIRVLEKKEGIAESLRVLKFEYN